MISKIMTPLEYMIFALNMVFLLCYLTDFDRIQNNESITLAEDTETGKSYYYIQQQVSAFGFKPSVMFTIQLLVLFMFSLKLSITASYLINA